MDMVHCMQRNTILLSWINYSKFIFHHKLRKLFLRLRYILALEDKQIRMFFFAVIGLTLSWHALDSKIAKRESHRAWLFQVDFLEIVYLCSLAFAGRITWTLKRCSIIFEKKCLVQCALTYTRIQNNSHVSTAFVCIAWINGTELAMAETQSDARSAKLLAECLKVAIWKIFPPVFIWTAWLMCWQLENTKPAKRNVEIVTRAARKVHIVSSAVCFIVKSA